MNRWAVFLDMEGISKIFPENELRLYVPFDAALDALCRIGVNIYLESPYRLFAHQIGGDGLIIVSEFSEDKPEVPILMVAVRFRISCWDYKPRNHLTMRFHSVRLGRAVLQDH